jgi:hypothetical protein
VLGAVPAPFGDAAFRAKQHVTGLPSTPLAPGLVRSPSVVMHRLRRVGPLLGQGSSADLTGVADPSCRGLRSPRRATPCCRGGVRMRMPPHPACTPRSRGLRLMCLHRPFTRGLLLCRHDPDARSRPRRRCVVGRPLPDRTQDRRGRRRLRPSQLDETCASWRWGIAAHSRRLAASAAGAPRPADR